MSACEEWTTTPSRRATPPLYDVIVSREGCIRTLAHDVTEADARLIAAAPEVLGALRDLVNALPWAHHPNCEARVGSDRYDPRKCKGCVVSFARATIAKAEGR